MDKTKTNVILAKRGPREIKLQDMLLLDYYDPIFYYFPFQYVPLSFSFLTELIS